MNDRRPLALAAIVSIASLTVATVAVLRANAAEGNARPASRPTSMPASRPTSAPTSRPTSRPGLPAGLTLLPAGEETTLEGAVMCGKCALGVGETCNVVIWDQDNGHLVSVLANARLAELEKLTGT